ncbi:MAG: hypothetical protein A3F54_03000 [Candidatus Kerfeldbacteria bacterium RIFCSPHIGHO2_12_FULL_48_17]|uniref:Mechanosensitive ion channel protein MscS n=1 Tax=Candidatus Kerfeldbacteria bacterium RIFCSPHIGHO2_12_FULL_48_17 TaxID=1798542 RepID=A0A1G2B8M9_9BACT|nr:MAG: hypothetical protein A3F54_03000 [Candidatus Kerfeldbacteria bacterium RIFCSPHIGHO2_12_FULL_48_17]
MANIQNFIHFLKSIQLWENSAYDYFVAIFLFLIILIALKIFQSIILTRLKKATSQTRTTLDDIVIDVFAGIHPPFYLFVALFFATRRLQFTPIITRVIDVLLIIAVVYEIIRATQRVVTFAVDAYFTRSKGRKKGDKQTAAVAKVLRVTVGTILWIVGVLVILSNVGVNVTSIIASLGIGGIVLAFAVQNILSDILSSFSIYIDKPFELGDFITIGEDSGTVEHIGLKTTRIRSLAGEEIVIPNSQLTTARLQNYRTLKRRRVSFKIGVIYETPQEKLKEIPAIMAGIIKKHKHATFARTKLTNLADSAIQFETVYHLDTGDYLTYVDIREKIYFDTLKEFAKRNIIMAYPTQRLFIEK